MSPEVYASAHPWVHPNLPKLLRQECPCLHLFGVDTISIASTAYGAEAAAAHRLFLCESPPIFVMKDVDLSYGRLTECPWVLRLYPILFDDLDGVPVIALAEIREP